MPNRVITTVTDWPKNNHMRFGTWFICFCIVLPKTCCHYSLQLFHILNLVLTSNYSKKWSKKSTNRPAWRHNEISMNCNFIWLLPIRQAFVPRQSLPTRLGIFRYLLISLALTSGQFLSMFRRGANVFDSGIYSRMNTHSPFLYSASFTKTGAKNVYVLFEFHLNNFTYRKRKIVQYFSRVYFQTSLGIVRQTGNLKKIVLIIHRSMYY